jgi:molybdopterin synthase sulfur carrier subunit
MMLVKVLSFAGFREILGKEREQKIKESATVQELLEELAQVNARFKEAAFDESGELRDYVLLMINRKRIDPRQDLSRQLQEGDELAIFPPLAGG